VATHEARVPLSLFAERVAPVKHAAHKVTLDTNRAPPLLASLFADARDPQDGGAANVVSFAYGDGSDVTVIVSKNAGRYRLQSSTFGAMWLVLDELCHRLRRYYDAEEARAGADAEAEPFAISFAEALPLQDFFAAVDAHHAARAARNGSLATLSDRARQFRAAQKRLLVRFKDKNPQSLEHLDAVLTGAYDAVTSEAAEARAREAALRSAHGDLAAATRVATRLISLKFNLSDEDLAVLEAYLSPNEASASGNDVPEQGWEEWTEAATTTLLKTKLAKGGDRASATGGGMGTGQPLPPLQDTTKLKKHIAVVCERLARGARLAG
jgi:Bardet-Biedl syndrome 9 protein